MMLVSIDSIPGKDFEVLGMAKGTVVQSKNFGRDFMAALKTLVGGEIAGYTEMLNEARQIATKRMVDEATALGADAVVGVRYGSSAVMQGAAEVVAYGTAVKFILSASSFTCVFTDTRLSRAACCRSSSFVAFT